RPGRPIQRQPPERLQRVLLELLRDHLEQAAQHVQVVFLLPETVECAFGVFELGESGLAAGDRRLRPPEAAGAAADDGAEPGAEGAGPAGMAERGQGARDAQQDALGAAAETRLLPP